MANRPNAAESDDLMFMLSSGRLSKPH